MKKTYQQPSIGVNTIRTMTMICGSRDVWSDKGIGFGGVDETGGKDPASRRRTVWDDDEEDEEDF